MDADEIKDEIKKEKEAELQVRVFMAVCVDPTRSSG
jgi:hypothetical protein